MERTSAEYVAAVQSFLRGTDDYVALLIEAALASGSVTQVISQAQTPSSKSVFIKMKKLGSGSFGEVSLVWDVSLDGSMPANVLCSPRRPKLTTGEEKWIC